MTKQFRVMLPVKPHIRKFLHCRYGYPVKISHQHQLGSILLSLLEKKSYLDCGLDAADRKKRMKRLTSTVECFASVHRRKQAGLDVPEHEVILINRLLEEEFEKELHAYVKHNVGPTGRYPGYMDALRGFMQEYHICEEIDMPLDTLKKMEYRHRQQIAKNRQRLMQADAIIH